MVYFWAAGRSYPLSSYPYLFVSDSSLKVSKPLDLPATALNSELGWSEQRKVEDKYIPLCL